MEPSITPKGRPIQLRQVNVPKLVVFDLDFTLWDCGGTWCDCLTPPFLASKGFVEDARGAPIRLYADVPGILEECDRRGLPMALASRTNEPGWARELLGLLGIQERFAFSEIYPSSKRRHFQALRSASGLDYHEMLFFDDEQRNITECSSIGVRCVFVEQGMNFDLFREALDGRADDEP